MNTNKLKSYAPKARLAFIEAITKRAALLGLYAESIAEITMDGESAIIEGRVFTRQQGQQRNQLVKRIEALGTNNGKFVLKEGFEQFINETAFTWFNRLTAIRYMEVNGYLDHGYRVLSKGEGSKFGEGFEILGFAADVAEDLGLNKSVIVDMLLDGNKEEELYRAIVLGQCHQLSKAMPHVFGKAGFEKLDEAIELLLPDNLTKTDSILKALIDDIPEDNWKKIEVIGWLYQFYISERKDAVIGKVVKREDIPAATQLFTPNWIVKYLVQNSLGRQWLATYPESDLKEKMEYYISPAEQSENVIAQLKAITPTSIDPETIKVLDPACGSGHILVEVYEVLREIYLERGYRLRDIPELILTKNIYGLDIDDRAAQMASFAVLMKAREDDKRIFSRIADNDIKLNIYSLQSTEHLDVKKTWLALDLENKQKVGAAADMFAETENTNNIEMSSEHLECLALLMLIKSAFINAKNLGSLIDIKDALRRMLIALNMRQLNLNGDFNSKNKLKIQLLKLNDPKSIDEAYILVKELELLQIKMNAVNDEIALFKTLEHDLFKKVLNFKTALLNIHTKSDSIALTASYQLMPFVEQALVLLLQYDAVVANPPYMGGKGMNKELKDFAKKSYPNSKSDLFSIYIEKCLAYGKENAEIGMVTPYVWMFISSYEKLRKNIVGQHTLSSLVQLEYNAFAPACIPVCTFTINKSHISDYKGGYIQLSNFKGHENQGPKALEAIKNRNCGWFFETIPEHFKKISGSPIAYWLNDSELQALNNTKSISNYCEAKQGLSTGDTNKFLRYWFEVCHEKIGFDCNNEEEFVTFEKTWAPYNKGGTFRKWYGNQSYVVNWHNYGEEIESFKPKSVVRNKQYYFRECISWSDITSSINSFRYYPKGFIFDTVGHSSFYENKELMLLSLGSLNSDFIQKLIPAINPTMHFSGGYFLKLPLIKPIFNHRHTTLIIIEELIDIARNDWNESELSFQFRSYYLLKAKSNSIARNYSEFTMENKVITDNCFNLENQLQDRYSESLNVNYVPIQKEQISLFRNDLYIFSESYPIEKMKGFRQSRTILELISYSLGCMMGRYSLDREGLVYANSGNKGFKELVAQGAYNTFPADDDGIIPLADEEWVFEDDATTRFREFVKTVWGKENLQENLDFVAESLCLDAIKPLSEKAGQKESSMASIRRYFSNQFFKDHLKTYKKRPIYWLFSSGKEKAFECLVYLHRYNESTLSRMRTEYVTPLMGKFESRKNILNDAKATASGAELRNMDKEIKTIEKKQAELIKFDEELKHLAEMKINIDLDDGVKVNYGKFGNLLAEVNAITGVKTGKK